MPGPFYRIRVINAAQVRARIDNTVNVECYIEIDPDGNGQWGPLPDGSDHFDVNIPVDTITAIDANVSLDTQVKKRKALQDAVIAADPRLTALRNSDTAARLAINWLNLKTGESAWTI